MDYSSDEELRESIYCSISNAYRQQQMPRVPWHHNLHLPMESLMVAPDLKEIIEHSGSDIKFKPIKMEDIFQPREGQTEFPLRILLEGRPMCGKTTLTRRLAMDWAEKQAYLKRFQLLFCINIDYLDCPISDVLFEEADVGKFDKARILEVLEKFQHNMLIILNKIDQCPEDAVEHLTYFLNKKPFPKATILALTTSGQFRQQRKPSNIIQGMKNYLRESFGFFSVHWDKRILHDGLNPDSVEKFLEIYLTESYALELVYPNLLHVYNDYTEGLYRYPGFLMMLGRLCEENEFTDPKTRTLLYKHFFNSIFRYYVCKKKNNTEAALELFEKYEEEREIHDMLYSLGECCWKVILNDGNNEFLESVLPESCVKQLIRMGFLGSNVTILKKRQVTKTYTMHHVSLIEFAATYYLRTIGYKSEKDLSRIIADNKDLYFRPGTYKWVFLFLAGLLKEKVSIIFDALSDYAAIYKLHFLSFIPILEECEEIDKRISCLNPYLPQDWRIHWHELTSKFANSDLHKMLLGHALETKICKSLRWHVGFPANIPDKISVDRLEFTVNMRHLLGLKTLLKKQFECTNLVLFFDSQAAKVNYERFIDFLYDVKKTTLACYLNDRDFVTLMPYLQRKSKYRPYVPFMRIHVTVQYCAKTFVETLCNVLENEEMLIALSVDLNLSRAHSKDIKHLNFSNMFERLPKSKNLEELSFRGDPEIIQIIDLKSLSRNVEKLWKCLSFEWVKFSGSLSPFISVGDLNLTNVACKDVKSLLQCCKQIKNLTVEETILEQLFLLKRRLDSISSLEKLHVKLFTSCFRFFSELIHLKRLRTLVLEFENFNKNENGQFGHIEGTLSLEQLHLVEPSGSFLKGFCNVLADSHHSSHPQLTIRNVRIETSFLSILELLTNISYISYIIFNDLVQIFEIIFLRKVLDTKSATNLVEFFTDNGCSVNIAYDLKDTISDNVNQSQIRNIIRIEKKKKGKNHKKCRV